MHLDVRDIVDLETVHLKRELNMLPMKNIQLSLYVLQ